jgi:hypothetical protein
MLLAADRFSEMAEGIPSNQRCPDRMALSPVQTEAIADCNNSQALFHATRDKNPSQGAGIDWRMTRLAVEFE